MTLTCFREDLGTLTPALLGCYLWLQKQGQVVSYRLSFVVMRRSQVGMSTQEGTRNMEVIRQDMLWTPTPLLV